MKNPSIKLLKISAVVMAAVFNVGVAAEEDNEEQAGVLEEVIVTGIRSSLDESVQLKRAADTVVDVITAEDIGQFSDDSIAGAINRIPGVQIETDDAGTDGDRVSIRGLGPEFVNSTINGRRLLSSGNEAKSLRKMNFNVFPPSVLAGVSVIKGQTASRPESGLAGQVDLKTIRPLDLRQLGYESNYTLLSLRGTTNDIDDEIGTRANVLTAWRNKDETLGAYVSFVISEDSKARDNLRMAHHYNRIFYTTTDGTTGNDTKTTYNKIRNPGTVLMVPIREDTERTALATGIQFRPNDNLNINWDLMYSNYNNESHRNNAQLPMHLAFNKTTFDNSDPDNPGLIVDDTDTVTYADFSKLLGKVPATRRIQSKLQSQQFDNETENLITGINVEWFTSDQLTTNIDAYVSQVDYEQDYRGAIFIKELDRNEFIYDGRGKLPYITAPGLADPRGYAHDSNIVRLISQEGDNYGFTLNFNYALESSSIFSSLEFGIHTDETELDIARSIFQRYKASDADAPATPEELMEGQPAGLLPEEFLVGENIGAISTWPIFDYNLVAAADPRFGENGWDELGVDNSEVYTMTEKISSVFIQANIDTEVMGMGLTGNVGVRVVETDNESRAYETLDDIANPNGATKKANATWTEFKAGNSYTEPLPSLNLNLALNDNMALRLGLSKTLSRPQYQHLAPINNIRIAEEDGDLQRATVGNPYLKPMTSNNVDVTFEWYTKYDGAFVLSVFYKDVSDFIIQSTEVGVPYENYEGLFDVTSYRNVSDGTAEGIEIGLYQTLGKLSPALDGFGFQVNYTYVDSELYDDVGDAGFGFPGSSQDNVNFIGFYEASAFSVRLAYSYRSEYFRSLSGQGSHTDDARFTGSTESLDLSVRIRPRVDGLSIQLAANNLTDSRRRDFYGDGTFFDYYDRGKTYSATLYYRF